MDGLLLSLVAIQKVLGEVGKGDLDEHKIRESYDPEETHIYAE